MIKLLPVAFLILLISAGLIYFRFFATNSTPSSLTSSSVSQTEELVEVPKTLPNATTLDRVKTLEDAAVEITKKINSLSGQTQDSSINSRLNSIEATITDLKTRILSLENATPAPAATKASTVYIPLGSGGGPWANQDWYTTSEYVISLDPANYPSYTGMYLEATFRMTEQAGTGSVRLYNTTDSSATSSQLDTTSDSFNTYTSSSFKLPSGSKTYTLQIKSTANRNIFIQNARIKVNF